MKSKSSALGLLAAMLEDDYGGRPWQGPGLSGALRGVKAAQAAWRPAPGRHSIQELTVHAAYWKYAVRRMLTGEKRGSFPEKGSNWFARRASSEKAWKADLALLDTEHRLLREAVAGLSPAALARRPRGSQRTVANLVYGVAAHDVYHTGQIQILKRLWRDRKRLSV
jgi:uncharacterized damage-inducible protein DinB